MLKTLLFASTFVVSGAIAASAQAHGASQYRRRRKCECFCYDALPQCAGPGPDEDSRQSGRNVGQRFGDHRRRYAADNWLQHGRNCDRRRHGRGWRRWGRYERQRCGYRRRCSGYGCQFTEVLSTFLPLARSAFASKPAFRYGRRALLQADQPAQGRREPVPARSVQIAAAVPCGPGA